MAFRPARRFASRLVALSVLLSSGLMLAACGARAHYVIKEPTQPLSTFHTVEVKPFAVADDVAKKFQGKELDKLNEMASLIAPHVAELFRQSEWGASAVAPDRLVIEGRVVSFDPGNQAMRYLIGFGAGRSKVIAEVEFEDASGHILGSSEFTGGVTMGGFGGTSADAVRRMANEIRDYVCKNQTMVAKK